MEADAVISVSVMSSQLFVTTYFFLTIILVHDCMSLAGYIGNRSCVSGSQNHPILSF